MELLSKQDSFNTYKAKTITEIEKRYNELKQEIEQNPDIDINAVNSEIEGLSDAKKEIEQRSIKNLVFNPVSSTSKIEKTFNPENVLSSAEYRSAFFKHLQGKKLNDLEQKAFNLVKETRSDEFNETENSGAVLPTQTINEIISKARTEGGLIAYVRDFGGMPFNIEIPIATPSGAAQWHPEGEQAETEAAETSKVSFSAYEILKLFSLSYKVKNMSLPAFEAYIIQELAETINETIDYALINGSGEGQGTGLNSISWTSKNSLTLEKDSALDWKSLTKLMALLKRGYGKRAKFLMNSATLYNHIYPLSDEANKPLYADINNGGILKLFGHDIIIDDNTPDNEIYFGDFNYLGLNMPSVEIAKSETAEFKKGLILYRGLALADCKPIINDAFVKLHWSKTARSSD